MEGQRLDKLIANTGRYSRKEAKELIRRGLALVNGAPAKSGEQKILPDDEVLLEGKPVRTDKHLYIMLNKPAGVVCATRDRDEKTVLDLLPAALRREGLFPAGRLDKDAEGFVLITDDGAFAHRILSPGSRLPKTYRAVLDKPVDEAALQESFASGVVLDGGELCAPAEFRVLEAGDRPLVEVVITEGKYHQVKRMFRRFGRVVLHLKRIKIGGLSLDESLPPGDAKEIMHKELTQIREILSL